MNMIQAISDWAKNLIFLVIFAAFLEMLLPSSHMQKFLRVIVGMLIMMAVLNPIVHVFEHIEAGDEISVFQQKQSHIEDYSVTQDEHLYLRLYEKELARQIKSTVKALDGVQNVEVVVHADEKVKQGKVAQVIVLIQEKTNGFMIKPINIKRAEHDKQGKVDEKIQKKVLTTVAELYQLSPEIIEVQAM